MKEIFKYILLILCSIGWGGMIISCMMGMEAQTDRIIKDLRQDETEATQWLIDCKNDILASDMDEGSKSFYTKDCVRSAKECCFYSMTLVVTKFDTVPCHELPPRKRKKYCNDRKD
jgi:hypothetical protein